MTVISSAHTSLARNFTATKAAEPSDPVGSGSTAARWTGGLAGAGLGIGAAVGINALTSKSAVQPIRVAGAVAGLAAVGGGGFLGQKLMGTATRDTHAESLRETAAKRTDLTLESRTLQAKADGTIDRKGEERVAELRRERLDLAVSKPEANFVGKWVIPAITMAGVAAAAGVVAYKLSPDDGKGITAMFNGMFAAGGGGLAGAFLGHQAGHVLTKGPHLDTLPAAATERVAAIDAELDQLLGA